MNCAEVGFTCNGTAFNDFLVGTPGSEQILGGEGNDVYQANGGNSILIDRSTTSSDYYTAVDPGDGQNTLIFDDGGSADFLDMGSFRALDDVTFIRFSGNDNLILNIDGGEPNIFRKVDISSHFSAGRIETIRFANGTLTGTQAESLAREATPEEQAALEEQRVELEESLPEKERSSSQDKDSPEKK